MAQTDRQTDKATHWAVTAYGNDILLLEDDTNYPTFVKKVYGGRELCPKTNREHFQGHLELKAQQRLSAIKKWLPTAHLEIARNFKASILYALKADTAAGDKTEKQNLKPYVTMESAMMKLVATCGQFCDCKYWDPVKNENSDGRKVQRDCCADEHEDYWHRVRSILLTEPELCSLYFRADVKTGWKNTKKVWYARARSIHSITDTPSSKNEIIFSTDSTNATISQA